MSLLSKIGIGMGIGTFILSAGLLLREPDNVIEEAPSRIKAPLLCMEPLANNSDNLPAALQTFPFRRCVGDSRFEVKEQRGLSGLNLNNFSLVREHLNSFLESAYAPARENIFFWRSCVYQGTLLSQGVEAHYYGCPVGLTFDLYNGDKVLRVLYENTFSNKITLQLYSFTPPLWNSGYLLDKLIEEEITYPENTTAHTELGGFLDSFHKLRTLIFYPENAKTN